MALTAEQKENRRNYMKEWRKKNKEKYKKQNKEYQKKFRDNNNNKEKIKTKKRIYRTKIIFCKFCGCKMQLNTKKAHLITKKHKKNIKKMEGLLQNFKLKKIFKKVKIFN